MKIRLLASLALTALVLPLGLTGGAVLMGLGRLRLLVGVYAVGAAVNVAPAAGSASEAAATDFKNRRRSLVFVSSFMCGTFSH